MSAGNAFANAPVRGTLNGSHQEDPRNGARHAKRQRLNEASTASLWNPRAQEETSLEVDIFILDFLSFQAIRSCLESRRSLQTGADTSSSSLGRHLQLANSFTSIFKARHPQYQPDAELRLRILLLKIATLFTQRFTLNPTTPDRSELQSLRQVNRERAIGWIAESGRRPPSAAQADIPADRPLVPPDQLERNRAHVLHQLGLPPEDEDYEDAFYCTASCVSLLDMIPLFVEVSAASNNITDGNLTQRWMEMACQFMLQACLEQYLVCGARGFDAVDEAFAWGYLEAKHEPQNSANRSPSRHDYVNDMFEDDRYATEVDGWEELKNEHIHELTGWDDSEASSTDNVGGVDIAEHMETVASKHPIDTFEASVLKFLEALSISISEPVLVQLENGKLDGMSKEETQQFLVQCGVGRSLS